MWSCADWCRSGWGPGRCDEAVGVGGRPSIPVLAIVSWRFGSLDRQLALSGAREYLKRAGRLSLQHDLTASHPSAQRMTPHIDFKLRSLAAFLLALALAGCGRSKTVPGGAGSQAAAISNRLAAIAAAGEPVTLEQLSQIHELPPADQDAAPLYARAFAAAKAADSKAPSADRKAVLDLLLQAAERPGCRYPVELTNGQKALFHHLSDIRRCAGLLRSEATNRAALGQTDAANKAIHAGIRLARSLDQEPVLISKLVEIAALDHAFDALEESLNQTAFSNDELSRLMSALGDAEPGVGFRRAMLGERANLIAYFQSSDEGLAEAMAMSGGGATAPGFLGSYRSAGHLEGDFAFALDFMSNVVAVVALPFPEALDAAAGLQVPDAQAALQGKLVFSTMLLPRPAQLVPKGAASVARVRIARTVLAVELYRGTRGGSLPETLAEVSAELSEGVPKDPFDGQPLRYRRAAAGGYVVWSVGPDRKDDGGTLEASEAKSGRDLMVRIAR